MSKLSRSLDVANVFLDVVLLALFVANVALSLLDQRWFDAALFALVAYWDVTRVLPGDVDQARSALHAG